MIAGLRGKIRKININKAFIDVNGVVYELNISFKSYDILRDSNNKEVFLFVFHSITDRSQKLFGFTEEKERELLVMNLDLPIASVSYLSQLDISHHCSKG